MSLWTTRCQELVGFGDTVALSLVAGADAIGRIVAETADGQIQCLLVRCHACPPGSMVSVDEDQLLLRVRS